MRKRKKIGQRKTTCSKCGEPLEQSRRTQRYCKKCHAESMRLLRPKHSELYPEAKKRANARAYAKVYLRRGKLIKQPCIVCGDEDSQMHHADYDKPLDVIWYCRKHHLEHHELINKKDYLYDKNEKFEG